MSFRNELEKRLRNLIFHKDFSTAHMQARNDSEYSKLLNFQNTLEIIFVRN